ncbi:WXG100 family type VII secretion target [Nocardioides bruguierae]|uniref:WXG100 family type VII secretion target n=1 Tax=Nocardioides bruguierae TaxID=2945102 RepID=UPI002020142F|nr:WXG100 family type VII secretion target [Nocardioides bruguierae]MCL8025521.1 WXG100 family type VII secretion target [Nocardioides bruguierae]MCL8027408.1 WXG100 family type VII secretion target [Nocardioides bruguierae]
MAADYGQGAGALGRAASLVSQARTDLDQVGRRLEGDVANLRAGWGGQGAAAFSALAAAWDARQRQVVAVLDRFEADLRTTEQDNTATDDAQQGAMARLQSALGALP